MDLRHVVDEIVAAAAVVDAFLMSFVAFGAGKSSFVLGMRIGFIFAFGLFDHGFVVAVAGGADIEVAEFLKFIVGRVACFAFHAFCYVPVG